MAWASPRPNVLNEPKPSSALRRSRAKRNSQDLLSLAVFLIPVTCR
jgi:hypothetical protein